MIAYIVTSQAINRKNDLMFTGSLAEMVGLRPAVGYQVFKNDSYMLAFGLFLDPDDLFMDPDFCIASDA